MNTDTTQNTSIYSYQYYFELKLNLLFVLYYVISQLAASTTYNIFFIFLFCF